MQDRIDLTAEGIRLSVDLAVGHIADLVVTREGRSLSSLHRAPWIGEDMAPETDPHLTRLSGDFLCAPFGLSDVEPSPSHGWPANAPWRFLGSENLPGGVVARFELTRTVMGARIVKEFTLRDGHPFLYQRHVFSGGAGAVSVGLHMMLSLPQGARLSFSPKLFAETPAVALEPDPARGRSRLAYPAHFEDLTQAPLADGGRADLTRYPFAAAHEDFVMLVEEPGERLAWGAALRRQEGDITLSLKAPSDFPLTLLWFSNGGRDYAPWNGRHRGVLGMEEARTFSLSGHAASIRPNPLSDRGIPTSISLEEGGTVDLRQVIGLVPAPDGWERVAGVSAVGNELLVEGPGGQTIRVPYDAGFLVGLRG